VLGLVAGALCLTPYAHQYDLAPLVPAAAAWLFDFKKHGLVAAALGLLIAWRERSMIGLVAGGLCLTPYAHQYDLAPLAPAAITWLVERKAVGWTRAFCGAGLLAGLVSAPLGGLAFSLGIAASGLDWGSLKRTQAAQPSAAGA